jgi:endonuclease YncB( thermonuclease family)
LVVLGLLIGAAVGVVATADRPAAAAPDAPGGLRGFVRVVDGDTLDLARARVRLWGVDAPERDQSCTDAQGAAYPCGRRASRALEALVAGREVTCEPRDYDRYGRTVARCSVDGQDLGRQLVRSGFALDYTRYSHAAYLPDELRARRDKAGVWQGDFVRPEDWRRSR